ncbi:class D sortase [Vallitalea sp.]|jgi:sortase A|uniref:class D sortase n=1 Tax=Vallitalea sp. TaxID=1882829 RepID=UPI0025E26293|nr:class D sortase [Vallitalea sp.]MCT4688060.1 class D sortase [Vallitalea sp.]
MRRVVSLLLIITGVILIALPLIGKYRTHRLQETMLEEFYSDFQPQNEEELDVSKHNNMVLNDIFIWGDKNENQDSIDPIDVNEQSLSNSDADAKQTNTEDTDSKTNDDSNNITPESEINEAPKPEEKKDKPKPKPKPKAIAIIKIDKIGIHLPIANGIDLETLKYAIGYMPESGGFGQIGNAVLAGHRSHTYGVFFNRLNELEQGDKINIITKEKEFIYTVYDKKIVDPDDVSVMRGSTKSKVVTLITCDPVIGATHRLIIHGMIDN